MSQKLTVKEKIGFSLGDMAGNFVYQSLILLLAYYYTDVFGLSAATVTTIFLVVRIFDAITDPLMGLLVDRTNSRWGKYRPYLLFLCVPYAVMSVLVFTVPELDEAGKTLYAYVTYAALMLLFTATNIPYFALGSVMTSDPKERVSLNTFRFVAAGVGGLIVTALLIPLADILGQGDNAVGYRQAMMVLAAISVVLFLLCFASTAERVKPVKSEPKNMFNDIKQVFGNDQWCLLGLVLLFMVSSSTLKNTMAVYYLNYYAYDAEHLKSLFLSLMLIGAILGSACAQPLSKKMCKRRVWFIVCYLNAVVSALPYFIPSDQIIAIMIVKALYGFVSGIMAPLIFSTMADITDYGELKYKRRLDGLIASFTLFSLKIGLAVGGALATYLLAIHDYISGGVAQTEATVSGILMSYTLIPAVGFVITAFIISRMKLTEQVVDDNAEQLKQQRIELAS